ncbi:MAG: DUF2569 domain-containing protein [Rhodobacteraceae bacterium]|nr:DUF2569 domain-containing protein [Paracoccaceae bacterium]
MAWVAIGWLLFVVPLALLKLAFPAVAIHSLADAKPILIAYSAIIVAPIAGYLIATDAYGDKYSRKRLDFHLSFYGRWNKVSEDSARQDSYFGPAGFLASLLIGLLLNVVVRTGEFFLAVPAMSAHAPDWGMTLFVTMSADVVIASFFYMAAFVMALRSIPLFPRMLLFAWSIDIMMQLVIAERFAQVSDIPPGVVAPLTDLLTGNVTKVLISIVVWMPYLLLSRRVNVTYRFRTPA